MVWDIVYKRAYNEDGTLFFPEKLTQEFLDNAKKSQGSYIFANQYLNTIIPSELQTFKQEWFRYYEALPERVNTFIFIDPALSEADGSDNTGVVVVKVDSENQRYVQFAKRYRINPTELIDLVFKLDAQFSPTIIGIEEIAYQKAILYFLDQEMRRRNILLPVKGVKYPAQKSKQMRILSLVPYFEWNRIYLNRGLQDLENELLSFPRGKHDDLIDSLASIDYIAYPPEAKKAPDKPHSANHPNYEKWYIQNLQRQSQTEGD